MGVDEVWRARVDAPHPRSLLAFIIGASEEIERVDGPAPIPWIGPVDLDQVPRSQLSYWRHWNRLLQAFEEELRRGVVAGLAPVLRPGLTTESPEVRPIVDLLVEGRRAALLAYDEAVSARSLPIFQRFPIKPIWAFIYLAKSGLRQSMPKASENALNARTADYLSQGIPAGEARKYALSRNHVDRACKRFIASLLGRVNSASSEEDQTTVIEATFYVWRNRLDAIEAIAKAAAAERRFRGLTGSELASAIDKAHGMHRVFYRVLDRQDARRQA